MKRDQWCRFCETVDYDKPDDTPCPDCGRETIPLELSGVKSDQETYAEEAP